MPSRTPRRFAFLACPIPGATPATVKISAIIDHSNPSYGIKSRDQKVAAFNGEMGEGQPSAEAPYGYTKEKPGVFFAKGELNYVGAHGAGDEYPAAWYLNYDGHAGYDFPYPQGTPILAAASGELFKATDADDTVYGQGWN